LGLLVLKRSNNSRMLGQLSDGYDVLEDGVVVFRILRVSRALERRPWTWARGDNGTTVERVVGRWQMFEPHRSTVLERPADFV
jgi:hypothetical protein